jgi:hypothetical protein
MTRRPLLLSALALVAGGAMIAGRAHAQADTVLTAALNAGQVGEQSDGYMGVNGAVAADVKARVDAINIKRRAAYTDLAAKRGVTVADAAAATGCQTLGRLKAGQAYRIGAGAWQVKGAAPIALPDYCATAG